MESNIIKAGLSLSWLAGLNFVVSTAIQYSQKATNTKDSFFLDMQMIIKPMACRNREIEEHWKRKEYKRGPISKTPRDI